MQQEVEFSVKVSARDTRGDVSSVECQLCVFFGRENDASGSTRKRKETERREMWRAPFRKKIFRSHMERQHPGHWERYRHSSRAAKLTYFNRNGGGKSTSYFEVYGVGLVIKIGEGIVDNVVRGLFLGQRREHMRTGIVLALRYSRNFRCAC